MSKLSTHSFIFAVLFLVFSGCRKSEPPPSCLMTSYDYSYSEIDVHTVDTYQFKDGLVDVATSFGTDYKMEYDVHKKLIGSKAYVGGVLLYVIKFLYDNNNRIIEEVWRDATTNAIYDHLIQTYDSKGDLVRSESDVLDYYCINTYSSDRALISWKFFGGGMPLQMGEYSYYDDFKNPFLSLAGLDYNFFYGNTGFGIKLGKRWYSNEKITRYDEAGNPTVLYEQDPSKTTWTGGQQHYPQQVKYITFGTNETILNTFDYENCSSSLGSTLYRKNLTQPLSRLNLSKKAKATFKVRQDAVIRKLIELRAQ
ncbi:MAG: hypothetical protein WKF97_07225 [Chitinophagaceae bacterium]